MMNSGCRALVRFTKPLPLRGEPCFFKLCSLGERWRFYLEGHGMCFFFRLRGELAGTRRIRLSILIVRMRLRNS